MESMRALLFLLFFGAALGCADLGDEIPPEIPVDRLLAAPDTVVVEGRRLCLTTYMWRDFMPISPPGGKPLITIAYVTATDTPQLSPSITADAIWIVHDSLAWKGWFASESTPPGESRPNRLVKVCRDGPTWGPHIFVDVIVRVLDGRGNTQMLRAAHQWIDRTD
jgi:hypothetical protein